MHCMHLRQPALRHVLLIAVMFAFAPMLLRGQTVSHGAIVRMDAAERSIYLVFTGHEFAEGADSIRAILGRRAIYASFFFTGDFFRRAAFASHIAALVKDGHYVGAHSDRHLLYCSWANRDSLLVTRRQFLEDLDANYYELQQFGISRDNAKTFLPPFEWYNDSIASWCSERSISLVNFTPGTSSNADYTRPGVDARYVSSDTIIHRILNFERSTPSGLNGFILLLHIGAGPQRPDPFHLRLDELLAELTRRGYRFRRF
jgi:peptidoglycan/xylan/chitin deacetylase (PgdA/CDA1 family)